MKPSQEGRRTARLGSAASSGNLALPVELGSLNSSWADIHVMSPEDPELWRDRVYPKGEQTRRAGQGLVLNRLLQQHRPQGTIPPPHAPSPTEANAQHSEEGLCFLCLHWCARWRPKAAEHLCSPRNRPRAVRHARWALGTSQWQQSV